MTNRKKIEKEFYKNRYNIHSYGIETSIINYWIMRSEFYYRFINESDLWNVFEMNEKNGKAFGYEIFISNDKDIKDFKLVMEFKGA